VGRNACVTNADNESRPLKRLLWLLSCRSKKVTARRAGVKQRGEAKLRPNYKYRTPRHTAARTKVKATPLSFLYQNKNPLALFKIFCYTLIKRKKDPK
jgi:hypothetical protein